MKIWFRKLLCKFFNIHDFCMYGWDDLFFYNKKENMLDKETKYFRYCIYCGKKEEE